MPSNFIPGANPCCAANAGTMLYDETGGQWELIPHNTQADYNSSIQDRGILTSSSGGEEIALCGPTTTTGTISYMCSDGVGPGILCVNGTYQIRWATDQTIIWDFGSDAPVVAPSANSYFEALIKITSEAFPIGISQGGEIIYTYNWRLVSWINKPACQPSTTAVSS